MLPADIIANPTIAARVHEVCGPAAVSFALQVAAQAGADVLWLRESWMPGVLNPNGFEGLDPSRVILVQTPGQADTLAIAEEALRDGAAAYVCLELTAPIGLTAGRRLQLAAKAGKTTGICLIPAGMGSGAAQTRWRASPVFAPNDSTLQCWELIKNKSGTIGAWHVRWDAKARRVAVVSTARQRPGPEGAPG